jgi:predicted phosphatase
MIDITITPDQISYVDSVLGSVSYQYIRETIEQVDAVSMHIETDKGVVLYNVLQYSFNDQSFTNTTDCIGYIDSL